MDRVLAVSELDLAAGGFQQVADGLANSSGELIRRLRDAASQNAQALMQHKWARSSDTFVLARRVV